ncbi:hypothetical protein [Hugenholtzia roseola]|uniref:hypothetical protein n=1 Tax=Hugenholtzia roseola TaxID=1002 RepID=UPI00047B6800|nr:hypothetical protein [Hugenholtzia roseola]
MKKKFNTIATLKTKKRGILAFFTLFFFLTAAKAQDINLNGITKVKEKEYHWTLQNSPVQADRLALNVRVMQMSEDGTYEGLALLHNGSLIFKDLREKENLLEIKILHATKGEGYHWKIDPQNWLLAKIKYEEKKIIYEKGGDLMKKHEAKPLSEVPFEEDYLSAEKALSTCVETYLLHYAAIFDPTQAKQAPLTYWKNALEELNNIADEELQLEIGIACPEKITESEVFLNGLPVDRAYFEFFQDQTHLNQFMLKGKVYCVLGENRVEIVLKDADGEVLRESRLFLYQPQTQATPAQMRWVEPFVAQIKWSKTFFNIQTCLKSDTEIQKVDVFINDIFAKSSTNIIKQSSQNCPFLFKDALQLVEGENKIVLKVYNQAGEALSEPRVITVEFPKSDSLVSISVEKPTFNWLTPTEKRSTLSAATSEANCEICIASQANLENVEVWVNNRALSKSDYQLSEYNPAQCPYLLKIKFVPQSVENQVEVRAKNSAGESRSEPRILLASMPLENAAENAPFLLSWKENYANPLLLDAQIFRLETCLKATQEPASFEVLRNGVLQTAKTGLEKQNEADCPYRLFADVHLEAGENRIVLLAKNAQGKESQLEILIQTPQKEIPQNADFQENNPTNSDPKIETDSPIQQVLKTETSPSQTSTFEWLDFVESQKEISENSYLIRVKIHTSDPILSLLLMRDGKLVGNLNYTAQEDGSFLAEQQQILESGEHSYSLILITKEGQRQSEEKIILH